MTIFILKMCHENTVSEQVLQLCHYPTLHLAVWSGSAADIRKIAVDCDSFITNCWTISHKVKWKGTGRKKKTTTLEELLNISDIQVSWLFF